ncbi:MAG: PLP-dependent transferase [Bacteroidota bacterium]|nr:PLP-dependent transferase [Bacteroidota bacterium]
MMQKDFTTGIISTGYFKKDAYNALQMPLYANAAYEFETAEAMADAFQGRSAEHTYSRITNPTVHYFEQRVQKITGAVGVTALNSGMAAITNVILELAYAGANIVTSSHLFGNTWSLFSSTLAPFGLETRFCDLTNPEEVAANVDENTCAIFLEIVTNPHLEVVDLKALSAVAKSKNVPLVADTTIIPFIDFHAQDFGVNIEIVSSTKYISGGATSIGGLVIDYGNFNWKHSKRLEAFAKQFGPMAFTAKMRKEIHRNVGAYMSPQTAQLQTLGLETVELRFRQASNSAKELAKRMKSLSGIKQVNHIGLEDHPYYSISKEQFGEYTGAMFTFTLDSQEACFAFLNKLKLIRRATNLFDNRTLVIHPASTIYGTFTQAQRDEMDIDDSLIRISIGLESVDELLSDIEQALA